jgi:ABC-2 type transport system permease protein
MNAWANVKTITRRELASYFTSPLAYVFIVIFLLLCGFFTFFMPTGLGTYFSRGEASLVTFFMWHPWFYLFLVPAVGMRLWAEERRVGTIELLLTMPITPWQAILGKFIASWLFLGIALVLTFPLWITTNYLGHPDNGVILATYLGSWLLAGAGLSISCVTSAMTRSQVVSFILSLVICLFLILAGYPPVIDFLRQLGSTHLVDWVTGISLMSHFQNLQKGILDSRDLLFFVSVILFSLFATSVVLRSHRAG